MTSLLQNGDVLGRASDMSLYTRDVESFLRGSQEDQGFLMVSS